MSAKRKPAPTTTELEEAIRNNRTVTVTFTLSDDLCASIMCTALEGGIGYWCIADSVIKRAVVGPGGMNDHDYVQFTAFDAEDEDTQFGVVTYETIASGVRAILMPGSKINHTTKANVLRAVTEQDGGEIDVDDADCIVQFGLFGELVYG